MSFMWKAKTSLSRRTSASAAPLSSVLGGFSGRQVASIQFNGGCCPGGINGQRHWRLLLLFVPLVIYSCASHKVNHPLSLTVHTLLSAREKSVAALFRFNQFLCMKHNQWLLNALAVDPTNFLFHRTNMGGKTATKVHSYCFCESAYLSCCRALLLFTAHLPERFCVLPSLVHNKSYTARRNFCHTLFWPHWVG